MSNQLKHLDEQKPSTRGFSIINNLLVYLLKKAENGEYLFSLADVAGDRDFDDTVLLELERDHKLKKLEGMFKGSANFVSSQERRNNTVYSPPERMDLFLKNLRNSLPSLYAEKKAAKGPAVRAPKEAEKLAPVCFVSDISSLSTPEFLDQFYLRMALCDLVTGRTELLDPVTGDAACQVRVPFILDARCLVADMLARHPEKKAQLCHQIESFRKENGMSGTPARNRPPQLLKLSWRPEPAELTVFFKTALDLVQQKLGRKNRIDCGTYLALSKALTETQAAYVDEFDLPSIRHNVQVYKDLQDVDKRKVALTENACAYLVELAREATEAGAQLSDSLSHARKAELLGALELSEAALPLGKGRRLPCIPMYPGIGTVLAHEHTMGRPLVVYVKRLGFTVPSGAGVTATEGEAKYRLLGSDVLFYLPDEQGGYKLMDEPDHSCLLQPALCVDAWSMIDLTDDSIMGQVEEKDRGLYSKDYSEYIDALTSRDITALVLLTATAHPPLPSVAKAPGHEDGWEDSGRQYSEKLLQAVGKGDSKILFDEYQEHMAYLKRHDLFELVYNVPASRSRQDERETKYQRIARNVPFAPIHIHASTLAAKKMAAARLAECLGPDTEVSRLISFETSRLPQDVFDEFK